VPSWSAAVKILEIAKAADRHRNNLPKCSAARGKLAPNTCMHGTNSAARAKVNTWMKLSTMLWHSSCRITCTLDDLLPRCDAVACPLLQAALAEFEHACCLYGRPVPEGVSALDPLLSRQSNRRRRRSQSLSTPAAFTVVPCRKASRRWPWTRRCSRRGPSPQRSVRGWAPPAATAPRWRRGWWPLPTAAGFPRCAVVGS